MNTNERILRLWKLGLGAERIATRIGRPGDIERVREAIPNKGFCPRCGRDCLFNPAHTCNRKLETS